MDHLKVGIVADLAHAAQVARFNYIHKPFGDEDDETFEESLIAPFLCLLGTLQEHLALFNQPELDKVLEQFRLEIEVCLAYWQFAPLSPLEALQEAYDSWRSQQKLGVG